MSRSGASRNCWISHLWLAGCESGASLDLRDGLKRLSDPIAIYGFAYTAPPPEGRRLRVALHEQSGGDPCSLHGPGSDELNGSFWYLGIDLGSTTAGRYDVDRTWDVEDGASVRLVRVNRFEASAKYRAEGGRVVVESTVDDAKRSVTLQLKTAFAARQPIEHECEAAGTADATVSRVCRCRFEDGEQTRCEPKGDENCCLAESSGELLSFERQVEAEYCSHICSFTSSNLARYCYAD